MLFNWGRSALDRLVRRERTRAERQQNRIARQVAAGRRRCRKQLAILDGLRIWASNYEMWRGDSRDDEHYMLKVPGRDLHYLLVRYYRNGRVSIVSGYDGGMVKSSAGHPDNTPQMWGLLSSIEPRELLVAADDAAYKRGAGRGTVL